MYGPAVRCKKISSNWRRRSCINVSGLRLEFVVLRAIMDISARGSIKRMVEKIHALTDRTGTWQETTLVGKVNRTLRGWANYFQEAPSAKRIGRSTATQRCGCAGGCSSSTKPGDARAEPIHSRVFTGTGGLVRLSMLGHDVTWVKA
jgi:RNA-directed DNA polymerase